MVRDSTAPPATDEPAPDQPDLTRLETFTTPMPPDELEGPDLGTLLGLEPVDPTAEIQQPPEDAETPIEFETPALVSLGLELNPEPAPASVSENLRAYSEQLSVGKDQIAAAFPFSLMIDGQLLPEEQEKLLDVLSNQNIEIREVDLEPQFAEGKVLIPRVSEFVCVMIVQALRASSANIRLGPADDIFATDDTRTQPDEELAFRSPPPRHAQYTSAEAAEKIPVTAESSLQELGAHIVLDVVTASAALSVQSVEASYSTEYQEMLESLQKELKFKAWRKGATAILNFSVQLVPLSLPSRYRMLVTGSAVRAAQPGPS